jgi:hypothetical protein
VISCTGTTFIQILIKNNVDVSKLENGIVPQKQRRNLDFISPLSFNFKEQDIKNLKDECIFVISSASRHTEGRAEVYLHSFLTSTLHGSEC